MLKVLRDSMKYLAWILWAVIAVFILFVFVDFGSVMPTGAPGQSAASVGDDEVTYREFQREYRDLEQQMQETFGDQYNPELASQLQLPLQALDRVINRKILLAEADRMSIDVTDEQLRDSILALPVFKDERGAFVGSETYDRVVRRLGYTPDQFEQSMRDQLLVQRVLSALERALVVPATAVESAFREETERATIRFALVPFTRFASELTLADDEIAAHFAAHRQEFEVEERRRGQYLLVDSVALRDAIEVPEVEKRSYYDEHLDEFKDQERVRARHILVHAQDIGDEAARARIGEARRRIEAGEEFTAVAKEVSDEPGADTRGGDLGWFGRGRMVKPFEDAAFAGQAGELVGPVLTQFGYHLIEVVERQDERQRSFEEVETTINSRLVAQRAGDEGEALANELYDQLSAGGAATAAALEALAVENVAVQFGEAEPFGRQGPIRPLGSAPNLNQAAFELEPAGLSRPVLTPRGWAVLRLDEVIAPHLPELDEVRAEVERDLRELRLGELAVDGIAAAMASGATLDEVAATYSAVPRESQSFPRGGFIGGLGVQVKIAEAAFDLPLGTVGGPFIHENNAVVFEVAERTDFDPVAFERESGRVRTSLERQELNSVLGSLLNMRRRELDVRYDAQLLESFEIERGAAQES